MLKITDVHFYHLQRIVLILMAALAANLCSVVHSEETAATADQIQKFTNDELRPMVAPIALYPDALLAQVLPASAYPLDIVAAYRYTQSAKDPANPPADTTWNTSVIALMHYPIVLKRMYDDIPWTQRLGIAVTYQMADVADTIQQVRAEAQAAGNLATNDKQVVAQDQNEITVTPADPTVVYVPTYQPDDIFIQHDSYDPYISFGTGFGMGIWLTNVFDWRYHRIGIYNDWYDGGWRREFGSNYWRAPYRSIPSWYSRGGNRSAGSMSNYGYRSGRSIPGGRNERTSLADRSSIRPAVQSPVRTPAAAQPAATQRSASAALTHAEGLGRNRQQVNREASRGGMSRQSVQPARSAPAAAPARIQQSRPAQSQNVMRPSSGQQTRNESSRGASSRSSGAGRSSGGGGGSHR